MNPNDPRIDAATADGQRMLNKITEQKSKAPEIVDANGQPIAEAKPAVASESSKAELERRSIEQARTRVKANAEKIQEVFSKLPDSERCANSALQAWRLLFWAMNELSTYEGMTAELIQQVSDSMRASALAGGYDISALRQEVERKVIPFLKDKIRDYAALQRQRKAALVRIEKQIGKEGISLPGHALRTLLPDGKFMPGQLLVVHGQQAAVRAALQLVSRTSKEKNGSGPFYLSSVEGEQAGDWADTVVPPAWWRNAAVESGKLDSVLDPALDGASVLVLVESLGTLFVDDGCARPPLERKSRALARLYEWSVMNLVAVVVGDDIDEDVPPNAYGRLPNAAVALTELDGRKQLVIGTDCLPLGE